MVGTQGIGARDFAVLREVHTGSWIGQRYQRQGFGRAMRAAVLALAFDGLAAEHATSAAFLDNPASIAISRRLGYCEDGLDRQLSRRRPSVSQRLRLDRASWLRNRVAEVEIEGLESCLPLFGLG